MKPCINLDLESNKPGTQLVRGGGWRLQQGQIEGKNTFLHPIPLLSSLLMPLALLKHCINVTVPRPALRAASAEISAKGVPGSSQAREGGMSLGRGNELGGGGGEAVGHHRRGQAQLILIPLTTDRAKMWSESSSSST